MSCKCIVLEENSKLEIAKRVEEMYSKFHVSGLHYSRLKHGNEDIYSVMILYREFSDNG